MKTMIALAAALAALATSGCWWPMHEGGHGRDERSRQGEGRGGERHGGERHGDRGERGDRD
jgi:Spy/CpxP family protein refolding chaperone